MGLKERVLSTVVNNLVTAAFFAGSMWVMSHYIFPWLISSGILHVTIVMKG